MTASMGRMTEQQTGFLLKGIGTRRVQHLKGMAHLEAWDVRRHLIRVFGFEGFTTETLSLELVHEHCNPEHRRKNRDGQFYGDPFPAWTVVYRAQVRLTIRDVHGQTITYFDDAAAGDAVNQPSLGDAHDMAMKTALSQALKRCAVNLGDQFGLSLYNDGSTAPVVGRSLAYMVAPEPLTDDAPVRPEPRPVPAREGMPEAEAPQREFLREAFNAADAETVRQIWQDAKQAGAVQEYLDQIADIGRSKPPAKELSQLDDRAADDGSGRCPPDDLEDEDEHTKAVHELRQFAADHGIPEIDAAAYTALGATLADVSADAIRGFLNQLRGV